MIKEGGYLDIDPDDVWEEWLLYKNMSIKMWLDV